MENKHEKYVIMFQSMSGGAGYIKSDNWRGHPQDIDRPKMTFSNKKSAIDYSNKLQKESNAYAYSVRTDSYPSRTVHQTKPRKPNGPKNH